ncbi:MAG: hypothetical protein SFZ02_10230 [bacterium]|nr:hypothetical protein [bacterium]
MTSFLRGYVPLLLIILVGVVMRGIAIQHTDRTNVIEQPLLDDSFYYFTLGRNLADGNGVMVDDQHITTGFQPLWGAMSVIPALLTNSPIRTIVLFQWMGVLVSVWSCVLVFGLTKSLLLMAVPTPQPPPHKVERGSKSIFTSAKNFLPIKWGTDGIIDFMALTSVAIWYWHPHHVAYSINGMETTLSTFATLLMLLSFVSLYKHPSQLRVLLFGMSCGVAFLARVDASLLILWLIIAIVLVPPIRRERIRSVLTIGVVSALVISPWVLFTISHGDFILPESGSAVRAHTLYTGQADQLPPPLSLSDAINGDPIFARYYGEKMAQFTGELAGQLYPLNISTRPPAQPDSTLFDGVNLRVVNIDVTHGVFFVLMACIMVGWVSLFTKSWMIRGLWLIACLWMITAIILYSFVVISWWFYERYTLPIAEIVSILMLCVVYGALLRLRLGRATGIVITSIVLVMNGVIFWGNFATLYDDYAWIGTHLPIIGDNIPQPPQPRSGFYEAAVWMNENVPPDAKIGAFQSGVIVYYTHAQVINLDGKVNADAHRAMTEGQMWDYICEQQLDYVVDWPVMIYFLLMQRSEDWQEGNLEQIALLDGWINPMQVNKVNLERCD